MTTTETRPPVATTPLTLSIDQAAQALGISRTLAYDLARRGDLRTVRLGRRIVVPRDAIAEMLAPKAAS